MKKVCISLTLICLLELFTGCFLSNSVDIQYNGYDYSPITNWHMSDETNYSVHSAHEGDNTVSVRIYQNDKKNLFLYCDKYSMLYYRKSEHLPEWNNQQDVAKFSFNILTDDNDFFETDDSSIVTEFISSLSLAVTNEGKTLSDKELLSSRAIINVDCYFNNFPAYHFVGKILVFNDYTMSFIMNETNMSYSFAPGEMFNSYLTGKI